MKNKYTHKSYYITTYIIFTGANNFSLGFSIQTSSEAHPAYTMGTWAISLKVKQLGHEADHSPPSSVEVKEWSHIPNNPHIFMAQHLASIMIIFTFTFTV
jgi:hypothetical protein